MDLHGNLCKLDYSQLYQRDPHPIPMPVDREGYQPDHDYQYWASGHTDWLNLNSAVEEFGIGAQCNGPIRLLDVGCSTGRFLRHPLLFGDSRYQLWGTDLAPANVAWVRQHLPSELLVVSNDTRPQLPYPDNFFDVLTGFSVMPHIEFRELDWLREFSRITRPGGLIYLSFGNETTWSDSADRESTVKHFEHTNSVPGNQPFSKATFESPLPVDRLVRHWSTEEVYNCFIWTKNQYIRDVWGESIHIHRLVDRAHLRYQAVMLGTPAV